MLKIWLIARAAAAVAGAFGAAGAAQAEAWWYVASGGSSVMIADADSIVGTGESRTATIRTYKLEGGPPLIGGARVEVECAAMRVRYLHLSAFTPTLQVEFEGEATGAAHEWRQLSPSNAGILLVRFVCSRGSEQEAAAARIGRLAARAGDRQMLARLVAAGVAPELAAPLSLGELAPAQREELLRGAPPEMAAAIRAASLTR